MRKLDTKLLRDLSRTKGQSAAIILVIAAGVATFVMSMCSYASLESSKETFYRDFRFADVFSSARRCPDSIIPRIQELSGVAAVETRLVYDVLLDVPEMTEPATARLISVPESGESQLNKVYICRGRMIEPLRTGEVVVSKCSPTLTGSWRVTRSMPLSTARFKSCGSSASPCRPSMSSRCNPAASCRTTSGSASSG